MISVKSGKWSAVTTAGGRRAWGASIHLCLSRWGRTDGLAKIKELCVFTCTFIPMCSIAQQFRVCYSLTGAKNTVFFFLITFLNVENASGFQPWKSHVITFLLSWDVTFGTRGLL